MMAFLRGPVPRPHAPAHLEMPHSGQCQVPASQCQSSLWLAAGQAPGSAGSIGSPPDGAGAAADGSIDAAACVSSLVRDTVLSRRHVISTAMRAIVQN